MTDLERNLDAYRILTEILRALRGAMRAELEKRHGKEWFRVGLPKPVLDRLIARKEREKAIEWYENEYQELVEFASFADILDILDANPDLMPQLKSLTPTQPLLHARMMELEVMREKLAMARAINEAQLAFLGSFHLRIHKALDTPVSSGETGKEKQPTLQAVPDPEDTEDTGQKKGAEPPKEEPPKEPAKQKSSPRKARRPKMKTRIGRSETFADAKAPSSSTGIAVAESPIVTEEDLNEPEPDPAPAKTANDGATANALAIALDNGDNVTILRSLYKEVTALAEGLWSSDEQPSVSVWPRVREHAWYEEHFSGLGLQPLSDFYEILDRVTGRMSSGASREEIQQLLKENNFAKVLLALRDMFQKNQI